MKKILPLHKRLLHLRRWLLLFMKCFLPVLFVSYMAGITLFTHSHVVNGVTIVHSHPFKKGAGHSHTTNEVQLIHHLSHVLATDAGIAPVSFSYIPIYIIVLATAVLCFGHTRRCAGLIHLRAPPVASVA